MKKTKISAYAKATARMDRETNRAIAHVEKLSKMYTALTKKAAK